MTSILSNATSFNDGGSENIGMGNTKKKHGTSKTTQKRSLKLDENKVKEVLQYIHQDEDDIESDVNELGNFTPLAPPTSATQTNRDNYPQQQQQQQQSVEAFSNNHQANNTLEDAYMTPGQVQRYYKNVNVREPTTGTPPTLPHPINMSEYDDMKNKLNYIVNLLEEQHDERTSNVTEDVVLYSFLGVFVIFVVDSFARVGKYTR